MAYCVVSLSLDNEPDQSVMAYCVVSFPLGNKPDQSVMAYCVVFPYKVRSVCYGLMYCVSLQVISKISLLWLTVLFFPIKSDQSVMAYCVVSSLRIISQISLLWLTLLFRSLQLISQISLLWLTLTFSRSDRLGGHCCLLWSWKFEMDILIVTLHRFVYKLYKISL